MRAVNAAVDLYCDKEDRMWENNEFRIRVGEKTMRDFERVMLTSDDCRLFMPMGFISEDDGETICYDCSGFTPLSSYRIERTDDVLYILERTLLVLGKSVEYMLSPSRIRLTTDTVFHNKDTGEVKIAYVPMAGEESSLRKNLVAFIAQLKRDVHDGYTGYIVKTAEYIYCNNYYIKDIVNKIGLFRRDIYEIQRRKGNIEQKSNG